MKKPATWTAIALLAVLGGAGLQQAVAHGEDGEPEQLVSFRELCGARNCSWAIYATNDGCSGYVGILEGSAWRALRSSHHELKDIATTWSAGCAGAERYEAVLEYDGLEYRQTSSRYVNECPPAESDP